MTILNLENSPRGKYFVGLLAALGMAAIIGLLFVFVVRGTGQRVNGQGFSVQAAQGWGVDPISCQTDGEVQCSFGIWSPQQFTVCPGSGPAVGALSVVITWKKGNSALPAGKPTTLDGINAVIQENPGFGLDCTRPSQIVTVSRNNYEYTIECTTDGPSVAPRQKDCDAVLRSWSWS